MSLQNTNLLIQASHLPPTFSGSPDELFQAMIERMKIVSPSGTSFFVESDVMPSSNVGPWLKGGTEWWVFDKELKTYVPLDISESETIWFQVSTNAPATAEPPLWLQIANDGNPVGWYWWNGASWVSFTALLDHSVTLPKLVQQPIGSLISFDASGNAEAVSGGTPGQIPMIDVDGRVKWKNSAVAPGTINGLVGTSKNLIIKNTPGDETTQLDITADSVIMQSNAGDYSVAANVIDLVDITVAGIGGLDTGSETASTWYYVWLISNGASNSPILSTSPTSPVLPSGYVFKALLGAVYNDAGSDLISIWQTGRDVFTEVTSISTGSDVAGDYSVATAVPPIAKRFSGTAKLFAVAGNFDGEIELSGDSTGVGKVTVYSSVAGGTLEDRGYFELPLITPQSFYFGGLGGLHWAVLDISRFTI